MKKLVIFDLDGTLIDTIIDAGRCFNKVLEYFGLKTYPIEKYKCLVGGNLEVIFANLLEEKYRTPEVISKLKNKYREIYFLTRRIEDSSDGLSTGAGADPTPCRQAGHGRDG